MPQMSSVPKSTQNRSKPFWHLCRKRKRKNWPPRSRHCEKNWECNCLFFHTIIFWFFGFTMLKSEIFSAYESKTTFKSFASENCSIRRFNVAKTDTITPRRLAPSPSCSYDPTYVSVPPPANPARSDCSYYPPTDPYRNRRGSHLLRTKLVCTILNAEKAWRVREKV